jgi:hypothetical protein
MGEPSKIGGAASPDCLGKEGTDARSQLSQENKKVSPFCRDCKPIAPGLLSTSFRIFTDRVGLTWLCEKPLTCDYAIVLNGAIASCRVRTVQLNAAEKELGFL